MLRSLVTQGPIKLLTNSALLRMPNRNWHWLPTFPGVKNPGTGFWGGVSELSSVDISRRFSDHVLT